MKNLSQTKGEVILAVVGAGAGAVGAILVKPVLLAVAVGAAAVATAMRLYVPERRATSSKEKDLPDIHAAV